jgi:hypothetical protein
MEPSSRYEESSSVMCPSRAGRAIVSSINKKTSITPPVITIVIRWFLWEFLDDRRPSTLAVGRGMEHPYTNNKDRYRMRLGAPTGL